MIPIRCRAIRASSFADFATGCDWNYCRHSVPVFPEQGNRLYQLVQSRACLRACDQEPQFSFLQDYFPALDGLSRVQEESLMMKKILSVCLVAGALPLVFQFASCAVTSKRSAVTVRRFTSPPAIQFIASGSASEAQICDTI
jgi:hypothetical protein